MDGNKENIFKRYRILWIMVPSIVLIHVGWLKMQSDPKYTRDADLEKSRLPIFVENEPEEFQSNQQVEKIAVQTGNDNASTTVTTSPPNSSKYTNKRQNNPMAKEAYLVLKKLGDNIKVKDEFDVFDEHVACQLRKCTDLPDQALAKQN